MSEPLTVFAGIPEVAPCELGEPSPPPVDREYGWTEMVLDVSVEDPAGDPRTDWASSEWDRGPQTMPLPPEPVGIDATLAQRGTRYGVFADQAKIADGIIMEMMLPISWWKLAPDQREALRVIANKIARILNGDPDYSDSWHDIAGYATLVDKRLKDEGK